MNAYEETLKGVQWVLDNRTSYRVAKDLDITNRTINRYQNGESPIDNMSVATLGRLYNYYIEEMEEMKNINMIIEGIEAGKIELENLDPVYHEEEYVDGPEGVWIGHSVERHNGFEVYFAEHDYVEELRQRIYEGDADESEFEELVHNEYADRFNYDDVVAYRVGDGKIQWV